MHGEQAEVLDNKLCVCKRLVLVDDFPQAWALGRCLSLDGLVKNCPLPRLSCELSQAYPSAVANWQFQTQDEQAQYSGCGPITLRMPEEKQKRKSCWIPKLLYFFYSWQGLQGTWVGLSWTVLLVVARIMHQPESHDP